MPMTGEKLNSLLMDTDTDDQIANEIKANAVIFREKIKVEMLIHQRIVHCHAGKRFV